MFFSCLFSVVSSFKADSPLLLESAAELSGSHSLDQPDTTTSHSNHGNGDLTNNTDDTAEAAASETEEEDDGTIRSKWDGR